MSGATKIDNWVDDGSTLTPRGGQRVVASSGNVSLVLFNNQVGTTYQLVLADQSKLITLINAAAITLTVPNNVTVPLPVGAQVDIVQGGAGTVTVAAGGGVTINSAGGLLSLNGGNTAGTLIKTGIDTWLLTGNLA